MMEDAFWPVLMLIGLMGGILTNWLLIAIPLFVFMGLMLERSGIAERLLKSLASIFRGLPGGYGFAVAVIGMIYRGVVPFVVLQILALASVIAWPQIALYIPNALAR